MWCILRPKRSTTLPQPMGFIPIPLDVSRIIFLIKPLVIGSTKFLLNHTYSKEITPNFNSWLTAICLMQICLIFPLYALFGWFQLVLVIHVEAKLVKLVFPTKAYLPKHFSNIQLLSLPPRDHNELWFHGRTCYTSLFGRIPRNRTCTQSKHIATGVANFIIVNYPLCITKTF